jgi:hypothetical protein
MEITFLKFRFNDFHPAGFWFRFTGFHSPGLQPWVLKTPETHTQRAFTPFPNPPQKHFFSSFFIVYFHNSKKNVFHRNNKSQISFSFTNFLFMKKSILLFLLLSFTAASAFSQTGSITNISVAQRADNSGLVDVYFTLSGTALAYNISLEASLNAGGTYAAVPPANLSGDLTNINPGAGKYIVWNMLVGYPNTYSTQSKLKIIAAEIMGTGQPCPGMPYFTDTRDGKVYTTVYIGTQCWMKQNLNIGTRIAGAGNQTNNGTIEKYCYDDNESNCDYYGGLYQWNEMMQYTTTQGVKGICPKGWHLPTNNEWNVLSTFLGGSAGGKMK